jgi:hypothetical protein
MRINSLLDFLNSGDYWLESDSSRGDKGYALNGRMNQFERQDLATAREYVQYSLISYIDQLQVWLPSDRENGHPPVEAKAAQYDMDEDPYSQSELKEGEFYRKYGLPLAKAELPLFGIDEMNVVPSTDK